MSIITNNSSGIAVNMYPHLVPSAPLQDYPPPPPYAPSTNPDSIYQHNDLLGRIEALQKTIAQDRMIFKVVGSVFAVIITCFILKMYGPVLMTNTQAAGTVLSNSFQAVSHLVVSAGGSILASALKINALFRTILSTSFKAACSLIGNSINLIKALCGNLLVTALKVTSLFFRVLSTCFQSVFRLAGSAVGLVVGVVLKVKHVIDSTVGGILSTVQVIKSIAMENFNCGYNNFVSIM